MSQVYPATVQNQQPGYGVGQPGYGPPQQAGYGNPSGPVMAQPGEQQWMSPPAAGSGCPPGLEYLTRVDQVFIKQQVELFEAFTGYETNNKYVILNALGQKIFFAAEETCCCTRGCFGNQRSFTINILDNLGRKVMELDSPCRCDSCFCPCCLKRVEVQAPPGELIGMVEQCWSVFVPKYQICNGRGEPVLLIEGPCFPECELCGERVFQLYTGDGKTPCGQITKKWSGFVKEVFTDSDNFGITFPMDLDVNIKATVMAATFLIDFMYFETGSNDDMI